MGRENSANAQTQKLAKMTMLMMKTVSFTRARGELMKNEIGFVNT
jgi:hypothetical protein